MRVIQTGLHYPLSSVKPLEGLLSYRAYCIAATRRALERGSRTREQSPADGSSLQRYGEVDGMLYTTDRTGSLFLRDVADGEAWAVLLMEVSQHRQSPQSFHAQMADARDQTVYGPKLEWIENTLRMERMQQLTVMEVVSPPSAFTRWLHTGEAIAHVVSVTEAELARFGRGGPRPAALANADPIRAAVLLEALDRSDDPGGLLAGVLRAVASDALVFITAMLASGFDLAVLGTQDLYLFPPDRANCFSLDGMRGLLAQAGLSLLEASTPGTLDLEIVQAHLQHFPTLSVSRFERTLMSADEETRTGFVSFLQQRGLSSFGRFVGRVTR